MRVIASVILLGLSSSSARSEERNDAILRNLQPDDWGLRASDHHRDLPRQRFKKLLSNPFDRKQWRSLLRIEGMQGLDLRIDKAQKNRPSTNVKILRARWFLEDQQPKLASEILSSLLQNKQIPKSFLGRTFDLLTLALKQSERWDDAVQNLMKAAVSGLPLSKSKPMLKQALAMATNHLPAHRAHEIVVKILSLYPNNRNFQLEVAKSAYAVGKFQLAQKTFQQLADSSSPRSKVALMETQASLAFQHQRYPLAANLFWSLLNSPTRSSADKRSRWWRQCLSAHVQSGSDATWLEVLRSKVPKHFSRDSNAWATLAKLYARQGRANQSVQSWQHAIDLDPNNSHHIRSLIEAFETASRFSDAVKQLRTAKRIDHVLVEHGLALAKRLFVNGERNLGLEIATILYKRASNDLQTLNLLIDFYNAQSQHDLALKVAQHLSQRFPRQIDARIILGEQLYQQGYFDQAIEQWKYVPKLTHPKSAGWLRLAEILGEHADHQRKLWKPAFEALEKAQKLAPNNPQILRLRAVFEESRQREDLALDLWQRIYWQIDSLQFQSLQDEARTRTVELLVSASLSHKSERRRKVQELCIEKINSSEAAIAELAVRLLAEFHIREENYRAASKAYRIFFSKHKSTNQMRVAWAAVERRSGNPAQAKQILEEVLADDSSQLNSLANMLTELSFETGNYKKAKSLAQSVAAKTRGGIDSLLHLAKLQYARGNISESIDLLNDVLAIEPHHAMARQRLAEIYLHKNQLKKSASLYSTIARNFKGQTSDPHTTIHRNLDLAHATGTLFEQLDLYLFQAQIPQASASDRERLLTALEHLSNDQLESWYKSSISSSTTKLDRFAALRLTLLAALQRDSVGSRLRAAKLLGQLALPQSGESLARIGAYFNAPSDSPRAIQDAYTAVRIAALKASAIVDQVDSIPTRISILKNSREVTEVRNATVWSLASSKHAIAHQALTSHLQSDQDPVSLSMLCLAITLHPDAYPPTAKSTLDRIIIRRKHHAVQSTCLLARANLTTDNELAELNPWFHSLDPITAAIAAWRVSRAKTVSAQNWQDLFALLLGAPGIGRKAASAAIYNRSRNLIPPLPTALPHLERRRWTTEIQRWLLDVIAPRHPQLQSSYIQGHCDAWRQALATAKFGNPNQRFWAQQQNKRRSIPDQSDRNQITPAFCQP